MIKSFFHTIYISAFPQPKTYKSLLRKPILLGFIYFFILIISLNTLLGIIVIIRHFSSPINYISIQKPLFTGMERFPNNLKIFINHGELSTSYNRPLFLWGTIHNQIYPLLVVDEYADSNKIKTYDSTLLLSANTVTLSTKHKLHTIYYPQESITIDKSNHQIFVRLFKLIYLIYPFIFTLYVFIIKPFTLLLNSLLFMLFITTACYILFYFLKKKLNWESIFHMALYSTTVPIFVYYFIQIIGGDFKQMYWLPLLSSLFLLGAIYEVYIYKEKHSK